MTETMAAKEVEVEMMVIGGVAREKTQAQWTKGR